jgi:hypothetical protein
MDVSDARRLKALEDENRKLKKLLVEDRLQHQTTTLEPRRAHTDRVCSTPPREA